MTTDNGVEAHVVDIEIENCGEAYYQRLCEIYNYYIENPVMGSSV